MDLIPYELLQLISSYLLPKYQCRLALTARHCYHYLYNDLLRWHAKISLVKPCKCEIINNQSYTREHNGKIIRYVPDAIFNLITDEKRGVLIARGVVRDRKSYKLVGTVDMYYHRGDRLYNKFYRPTHST